MDLTGIIIAILPLRSGTSQRTGNTWATQDYVIEVPGQYPKKCVFSIFGEDRIKQMNIQMGENCTVSFDIDAHEYNGRWYNEVRAYNVVHLAPNGQPAQAPAAAPATTQQAPAPQQQQDMFAGQAQQPTAAPAEGQAAEGEQTNSDDLPF